MGLRSLDALDIPEEIRLKLFLPAQSTDTLQSSRQIPAGIPIAGAAGDQQAALFGQTCFEPGTIKATFGTGAFILMNTGSRLISSDRGLVTTVAWGIDGKVDYALEGSVFVAGAAVQWLRDELGLIKQAAETEALALSVPDTNGVYFVPSFVGLGAPHWEPYVRGMMMGITRGVTKSHLVRATLEAIVFQTKDVVDVMAADAQLPLKVLKVDGGASVNNFICQFLADLTDIEVQRPRIFETTALGAAYLAGLAVGFWNSPKEIREYWQADQVYKPEMRQAQRLRLAKGWKATRQCQESKSDD